MNWSIRRACCLFVMLVSLAPKMASADEPKMDDTKPLEAIVIREYRSSRLHVRTDLSAAEAESLYERLEETLQFASRYWGRKPKGQIECFVVHDLSAWTDAQLPHRLSRVIIDGVGGATMSKSAGSGNQSRDQPIVLASSKPGVAEHELIHAYCIHTFGSSGPEWYKEGMAEMAVNRSNRESGVQCSVQQSATLRGGKGPSLTKILAAGSAGARISASLRRMMDDPETQGPHVPTDVWTDVDAENVAQARDEYLHSWAFCYMMLHNPNYSKRFHSLGTVFVAEQRNAFDEFFAPVRDRIEFEHQLFLQHASIGYRVDLCSWDWDSPFRTLPVGASHKTCVMAGKGYQASGLNVISGQRYVYSADGNWSLSADAEPLDANGDGTGAGRLTGIVLHDRTLGQPFPLGNDGTVRPTTSGRLYLRCDDAWNEIADNSGQVTVTFSGR